eukprot:gene23512-biopygen18044
MAFAVRSTSSISMAKSFAKSSNARLSVVSRASEQEPATPAPSTSESAPQKVVSTSAPEENKKAESFGPFTPNAELLNGRAAMIGFAALLAFEATNGAAMF